MFLILNFNQLNNNAIILLGYWNVIKIRTPSDENQEISIYSSTEKLTRFINDINLIFICFAPLAHFFTHPHSTHGIPYKTQCAQKYDIEYEQQQLNVDANDTIVIIQQNASLLLKLSWKFVLIMRHFSYCTVVESTAPLSFDVISSVEHYIQTHVAYFFLACSQWNRCLEGTMITSLKIHVRHKRYLVIYLVADQTII